MRTHDAGTLRAEHVGQTVTLAGWVARRRDHGGVIFIDLRDRSGSVQVVFREGDPAPEATNAQDPAAQDTPAQDTRGEAHRLRAEFCVQVVGEVVARPAGNENPELPTGAVEITATALTVLSESAPLTRGAIQPVCGCESGARRKTRRRPLTHPMRRRPR